MDQQWTVGVVVPTPQARAGVLSAVQAAGMTVTVAGAEVEAIEAAPPTTAVVIPLVSTHGAIAGATIERLRGRGSQVVGFASALEPHHVRGAVRWGVRAVASAADDYAQVREALEALRAGEEWVSTEWAAAIDACAYDLAAQMDEREELVLSALASGETLANLAARAGAQPAAVARVLGGVRERLVGQPETPGGVGDRGDQ